MSVSNSISRIGYKLEDMSYQGYRISWSISSWIRRSKGSMRLLLMTFLIRWLLRKSI